MKKYDIIKDYDGDSYHLVWEDDEGLFLIRCWDGKHRKIIEEGEELQVVGCARQTPELEKFVRDSYTEDRFFDAEKALIAGE